MISTSDLFERLIREVCFALEGSWQEAIILVTSPSFEQKMAKAISLADYLPLGAPGVPPDWAQPSASFSSVGSNTTFVTVQAFMPPVVPSASGDHLHSDLFEQAR